jgi:hypothetical protein
MPNTKQTMDALMAFKLNDMQPFDTSAGDLARTSLESAHALAIMLGSAFDECHETSSTNGAIIRSAFEGIARLVALAAFAGEAA